MAKDIGLNLLHFEHVRAGNADFADDYGFAVVKNEQTNNKDNGTQSDVDHAGSKENSSPNSSADNAASQSYESEAAEKPLPKPRKPSSLSIDDPKAVKRRLKFKPKGQGREKLVALLKEASQLNIERTPLAFCFILRSMFEISAKVYCSDHQASGGPSFRQDNGKACALKDVLLAIISHLEKDPSGKTIDAVRKRLHGASVELGKPDGILSVRSMNQLVHNQDFSIVPRDICIMFFNVFPLIEEMSS